MNPPVAVLLSRFPRVTETFILREVIELERRGWPVTLVPLMREHGSVVHPEAVPWIDRAQLGGWFTGWLSPAIAGSLLRALRRRPGRLLATLGRLVLGNVRSPGFLAKSLALFPKAVHLAERLREAGIAHVHAHFATHPTTVAWVIERLAGIPYSVTVHAHDIFVDRAFLAPKLRRARFVRVISEFNRRYLAERYPWVADRLEVIHVGIDPVRYRRDRPDRETERERAPDEPVRVLTVAALEVYKGIDLLIEVAAALRDREGVPPIVFTVLGEGYHRHDLEDSIAAHGLEGVVRLPGAVPQEEVARRMAEADLFVLPSIVAPDGQMEGIPVALMEAMASGLPVVATRLSGIPELVEDGVTGLLADPRDWDALADAVERLIREPTLGRRLGRAGRERVEAEFSLRSTVAELAARIEREVAADGAGRTEVRSEPGERALHAALAGAGLGEPSAVGVRRWIETGDSRVAEVLLAAPAGEDGGEPREVVVKIHRSRPGESAPPIDRAGRELRLLARLAAREETGEHGRPARSGVPRPLSREPVAVAGEDGDRGPGAAIVLERARGERLDRVIRRHRLGGRAGEEALESAFRRAGAWLRWFHAAARPGDGDPVVHGDFWPGNLFVTPDRVEGIDFEGSRPAGEGDPRDDAAYFLRHAESYFAPGSRRLSRFSPLRARWRLLEAAFLDGFQGGDR